MLDRHLIAKTEPVALSDNMVIEKNLRITVLEERLFRIEQSQSGSFCDSATQCVWYRNFDKVAFTAELGSGELRIRTGQTELVWRGTIEQSFVILKEEQKQIPLGNEGNLLGTYRTLDCCDGDMWIPFGTEVDKAEKIRLENGVVSENGVAILDDSESLLLREDGMIGRRENPEKDIYVFAYGKDYRAAVRALYSICGKTPRIPRFALGNWWSRYYAYTEKEYLHVMDNFEEREIPVTVATVDMDWHWSFTLDEKKQISKQGKNDALHGGADGWTGYSWNTDLFPDYKRFLKKLHERKLHVTLNLHPASGVRYFEDCYRAMAEAVGVNPETEQQIPFDMTDERFINAYFDILHRPYEHDGVDFWWIDWQQGEESRLEGLDPLWALNHYHFLDHAQEHEPLILSRYCGIGAHRYPLGFSGDTKVTWESLQFLPYFTATASNAGYSWWSHDIGGHMGGYKDDELYVRFVQFGVFSPINRLHSTCSLTFTKEPWAYGNGTGLIAAEFLRLRHRMIPFLYSASYETAENGLALVEPMYYEWPGNGESYQYPNQYMFGGQLLVAPITKKSETDGMADVDVWLPEGRWTDLFTEDEYTGGRELTMVRWLEEYPVLLKEGGFFVLDDRKYTNDVENPDCLKVYVTNGNGSYCLHEDKDGKRIDTLFTSEEKAGRQKVTFRCRTEGTEVPLRRYHLRFCNICGGEVTVLADGVEYPVVTDDNGRLSVVLEGVTANVEYEITISFSEQLEEKRGEALRKIVTKLQMDHDSKDALYKRLCACDAEEYLDIVEKTSLPSVVKARLCEII